MENTDEPPKEKMSNRFVNKNFSSRRMGSPVTDCGIAILVTALEKVASLDNDTAMKANVLS